MASSANLHNMTGTKAVREDCAQYAITSAKYALLPPTVNVTSAVYMRTELISQPLGICTPVGLGGPSLEYFVALSVR
jgi:hypothetical protein